jgi:hypothetical protein
MRGRLDTVGAVGVVRPPAVRLRRRMSDELPAPILAAPPVRPTGWTLCAVVVWHGTWIRTIETFTGRPVPRKTGFSDST